MPAPPVAPRVQNTCMQVPFVGREALCYYHNSSQYRDVPALWPPQPRVYSHTSTRHVEGLSTAPSSSRSQGLAAPHSTPPTLCVVEGSYLHVVFLK
ncbi:hypothetical protein E2C01_030159 [Portunus trituberculatus]|uniref:Uncharacterized protein n=1 Tax=Portunus trituberculatus TaxID=210409 RepID=A0A5B7EQ65_PORTR|nr:hypothetical protein [Portunus trituberculatus]